jgi:hypothetical protein
MPLDVIALFVCDLQSSGNWLCWNPPMLLHLQSSTQTPIIVWWLLANSVVLNGHVRTQLCTRIHSCVPLFFFSSFM